jgi:hypothetical protein
LFKGLDIIEALSNNCNLSFHSLEAIGDDLLVNWISASNNTKSVHQLVECLLVLWAHERGAFVFNDAANSFSELFRVHAVLQ